MNQIGTIETSQRVREPNFFIVGAPRCGTTAMSSYLSEHPQICFSRIKEPHFFSTDMPGMREFVTREDYLSNCFGHCDQKCIAAGEASVWYLYSSTAIDSILQDYPHAKFVAMVRNPIELVASFHLKALESLDEDVTDFAVAWGLQESRLRGENLPPRCRDPFLLQYGEVGKLGKQVRRFIERVPEAQRMIIVYDDLARDTSTVYQQLLEFLGVPYDGREDFRPVNQNQRIRSRFLWEQAWNPPESLMKLVDAWKSALGIERLSILPRMRSLLTVTEARKQMSAELRETLIAEFASDIDLLSELLQRDLSGWKETTG